MKIKDIDINVNEAIKYADYDKLLLKRRNNEMLLSDFQISVLRNNGLDYQKYNNIKDLLFDIEECLFDNYDDELDLVSKQIAELIYYKDTKKWEK